jgi:hypothetical protein
LMIYEDLCWKWILKIPAFARIGYDTMR